jgi:hypothetical protein
MKKWIMLMMLLVMVTQVEALWVSGNGASQKSDWFAGIRAFFTLDSIPLNVSCTYSISFINATSCTGETNSTHNLTSYDSNYPICCAIGGVCYRDDTNAIQRYYTDEVPCGEVDMLDVALAIVTGVNVILPMIFGLMLLVGSFLIKDDKEHSVLRIGLFLMSLVTYFISAWLGITALIKIDSTFLEFQDTFGTTIWIIGIFMFLLFTYFMAYTVFKIFQKLAEDKREKTGL